MKTAKYKPRLMPGEQWFEVVSCFDPARIEHFPYGPNGERAFVLGALDKLLVVEVPRTMDGESIGALGRHLSESGKEALIVSEGIRFLRLRALSVSEERDIERQIKEAEDAQRAREGERLDAPEVAGGGSGVGELRHGGSGGDSGPRADAAAPLDDANVGRAEEEADDPSR
jgi:hypothetical protein